MPIDDCGLTARNEMIVTWFNQRGRVWLSKCRCSSTPPSTIAGCVISESNEPALFNRLLQQLENPCQRRFWRRIQWQTFKTSRTLRSAVHEHVYLIGREALINAFRHADAKNIEVELEYAPRRLRVAVRDDGRGIDKRLQAELYKHWGLLGMRERSEKIGAKLRIWSRHMAGTEVELSVPGRVAFGGERSSAA